MKLGNRIWGVVMVPLLLVGCAHSMMRGSVAMKVSDSVGHVCMGNEEVEAGDKVTFFTNQCVSRGGARAGASDLCRKVPVGTGEVTRTLNEHYSVVRANPGVKLEEGMIVEKGLRMPAE